MGASTWAPSVRRSLWMAEGKVARVLRKVKPAEHDALVLEALAEVGPPVE